MRQKHLLKSLLLLLALIVGSNAWADTEKITLSEQGYSNAEQVSSTSGTVVTLTYTGGGTAPAYYNTGSGVRVYAGGKMTVTAGDNTITKVVVTFAKNNNPTISFSSNGTNTKTSTTSPATWEGNATSVDFNVASSGHARIQIVEVTYDVPSTSTLTSIALSGEYPTSFFVGDAFSTEGMTVTATYEDNTTKDVTSKAQFSGYDMTTVSSSQTVTVSYTEGEVTQTASYQIVVKAVPTHEVTWSVNGTTSSESYQEGANITFPTGLADIEGKTFVGWVADAIIGTTDETPTFVTSATMGTEALTYYAVFAEKAPGTQTTITDDLSKETLGQVGNTNTYADFSGKSITNGSDAVYAGNCILVEVIQMRSNNSNSGIVSTTSGGTLKSVTVAWTDGNTSGRILDIYGSNTPYSKATDLYDSKKQGTKLGSITYGTSTSLTISGDYAYVGLRSNSGAVYFTKISIEWIAGTPDTYSAYCTTVAADNRQEAGISFDEATMTAEIAGTFAGQALTNPNNVSPITWTSTNETVATVEDGVVTMLAVGETTIKASFAGDDYYKKADVSYTLTVQDSRTDIATINSLTPTSVAFEATGEFTLNATFASSDPTDYEVTYTSSSTDMLYINGTQYLAGTTKGNVNVTVKVEPVDDTLYKTVKETFTVSIYDPNANDGSLEHPYTVAEAIEATPTSGTSDNVYIKGVVSSFYGSNTSVISDDYHRYYISDDGTTANQLIVFNGKGLDNSAFSNADDLKIGDEVVILGGLTIYNNASEVAAGNYIVSLIRPVDTTPSIAVDPDFVDVDADEHDGTLALAYANLTITKAGDFAIQYYNAEGEELSDKDAPDWIEVTVAEQDQQVGEGYVVSYYMIENDGEARTAYFKVYAMDDETNLVYSNLVTVTQAAYVAPDVPVEQAVAGVGAFVKVTSTTDITSGNYLIVYETNSVAFDGSRETLDAANNTIDVIIIDNKIAATNATVASTFTIQPNSGTIQSASGLYIGVSSNSNGLKQTENAETYTNTFDIEGGNAVISAGFEGSSMTLRFNSGKNDQRFRYYKSDQQPIQLYKYDATVPPFVPASITAAGMATFSSDKALDFTGVDAIAAYYATVSGEGKVTFTRIRKVPANTGLLLRNAQGEDKGAVDANVPVLTDETEADIITDNALVAVDEEITLESEANGYNNYILNKHSELGLLGFFKAAGKKVAAGKAYLRIPQSSTAREFIGIITDESTGIAQIENEATKSNGAVYNLSGQRVVQPKKGLYIVNGKKVLVN